MEQRPRLAPPIAKAVLDRLYQALLCVRVAREGTSEKTQVISDGILVGATLPLQPRDLLIPPADPLLLRQCERLRHSRISRNAFPQVLRVAPGAHWQIAMAIHLAQGWKHRRRATALLALVPEQFLSRPQRDATLEILRQASQQRLPIVYVTRSREGRGAKLASSLYTGGVPRIVVDGNDVVAIYRVCQEALRRAREGTGPTIVDCHFLTRNDDLASLESFLVRYGLWSSERKQRLLQELRIRRPAGNANGFRLRRSRLLPESTS